ncbi:hypothetical protein [Natrinema sp. DC36]|uniref:hypothetical protein n=1 Tax=Natrinema sp. DC36 TaxID=2878680 RepID=UPI001CF03307|nr:hypothetical protein [Natrinema sp. DC36]
MGRAGTDGRRTSEPRGAAAESSDASDESAVSPLSGSNLELQGSRPDELGTDSDGGEATRGTDGETGGRNAGAEAAW